MTPTGKTQEGKHNTRVVQTYKRLLQQYRLHESTRAAVAAGVSGVCQKRNQCKEIYDVRTQAAP